jgi:hypothetical protein
MAIFLVTLVFDTETFVAPMIDRVGEDATLSGFLRRVSREPSWSWTHLADGPVLLANSDHLLQRIDVQHPTLITARYLFDRVHAALHPETLDMEHIEILHGTMAAKLFDEALLVLEPDGIAASLRWVPTERTGVQFQRDGSRRKTSEKV